MQHTAPGTLPRNKKVTEKKTEKNPEMFMRLNTIKGKRKDSRFIMISFRADFQYSLLGNGNRVDLVNVMGLNLGDVKTFSTD